MKTGFYYTHSYKAQQRQGWAGSINFGNDSNNPLDTGFGFSARQKRPCSAQYN
jgi:hypothetical protein